MSSPPPLVLNVEPLLCLDSIRFLELMVVTAGGNLSCQLWNPVAQALRSGERLLLRMPRVGGGTAKKHRLGLLVGTAHRMVQGCYTPMDLRVLVLEVDVEFVISTRSYSIRLVKMALHRVSRATENETNVRIKLLSGTLMGLSWMPCRL